MFLSELITVKEAINIIENVKIKTGAEKIPLEEAYNRVLAEDVISLMDSPPFDKAAMDGYAIKAEDTFGFSQINPACLVVVDEISAGQTSKANLKNKEAVKIATGAPMPDGGDAVVMEEHTKRHGNIIEVETSVVPGENVSFKGEDIKKGEMVLGKRRILRAQDLGIIASSGYDKVNVIRLPKVSVITTGNELVKPTSYVRKPSIINSNYYTLKASVESSLAIPKVEHCIDDEKKMSEQLEESLKWADAIITTGGTAISKGDVVVDVVDQMGEVLIHGVSIRPGKPFAFGIIEEKPIFMLSGYPVAAMVQFDVFVKPYLFRMQNIPFKPKIIRKKTQKKIPSTLGRTDFVRAKTDGNLVHPLMIKGSGVIRSMVESDCYIIIEENVEGIAEGEECDVLLYDSLKI